MPRTSPDAQAFITAFERGEAPAMPKNIILSHDKSCNLSCPSCRAQTYAANKATQAKLDALTDEAILPLLKEAENVKITGSGDPFGSNHFRNLIKRLTAGDFPHLKIELHTNGQLWDARAWRELGLAGHVNAAHISIDATEPDTYAFARRGGSFERLLANLAFVKELRERGEISHLVFSMVVQTRNFREMPAFVALGQRFKADLVSFQMIRQRDIFSREEHDEAFIGNPQHRDYAEFVEVLKDPVLDSSYVEIGNVRAYARAV
jgi:molybdenum cofactor biosynthesis enzyme MoaA